MTFFSPQGLPAGNPIFSQNHYSHYLMNKNAFIPPLLASDVFFAFVIILMAIILIWAGIPSILLLFVTAALATKSPVMAIKALICSYFISSLTPAITNEYVSMEFRDEVISFSNGRDLIGRYLVLIGAIVGTISHRPKFNKSNPTHLIFFLIFCVYILSNAIVWSYAPLVSTSKVLYFITGVFLVLHTVHYKVDTGTILSWIVAFFGLTMIIGLPLALLPQGYMVNGSGFQGVYIHPQTLGVLAGIYSIFMIHIVIENKNRSLWIKLFLMACLLSGLISLFLSEARTGVAAFFIGSLLSFPKSVMGARTIKGAMLFVLAGSFTVFLALISHPETGSKLEEFVLKGDSEQVSISELWGKSRGDLASRSMKHFEKNPLFGVGFGLPGDPEYLIVKTDPIFDLPIGASVEKGFIGSAILEELGITGLVLILFVIMSILGIALLKSSPAGIALIGASLASNLGEATLLSFGGLGSIIWLFIAIGLSKANNA